MYINEFNKNLDLKIIVNGTLIYIHISKEGNFARKYL